MARFSKSFLGTVVSVLLASSSGCSNAPSGDAPSTPFPGSEPLATPAAVPGAEEFAELAQALTLVEDLDGASLQERYPTRTLETLGYTPSTSEHMDRIQASALGLSEGELAALDANGFVISTRSQFPTFLRGYAAIYSEHLPVYVSADAILDSVHRSYDQMLAGFERWLLIPDLRDMLAAMRSRLASATASEQAKADADFYLAVAQGLLTGTRTPGSDDPATVQKYIALAVAAQGMETLELFGGPRMLDFSQFTPRGHYADDLEMQQYFRAMIWLGRVDLRLLETQSDGTQFFNRDQYETTLLFHQLLEGEGAALWQNIEDVVGTFVGQSDYMRVPDVASLLADLGGLDAALAADDATVASTIADGGYGQQQIASHLMVNDGTVKTLPLNRSFLIFGQRYVVDSHVFSETVFDRIGDRLMPNPLDAAFAALGNNAALALQPEIATGAELPGALGRMRTLIDAHEPEFWDASFYNLWLSALRALSPAPDMTDPASLGMPKVTGTEAWNRRMLNTQLASWAQLRHDTVLYAKQSYTSIPGCEFPDVYVEPYPDFFAALERYAERGAALVTLASRDAGFGPVVATYFDNLRFAVSTLRQMAQQQRDGVPHTQEQLDYINDAVRVEEESAGCTTIEVPNGWYASLFFNRDNSIQQDFTIADVHTQPADWGGGIVGKVLHVGTGAPRLFVTTVDTCVGPRAYVGVSSSYHELITDDFKRLNDAEWTEQVLASPSPADVPWLGGILAE